MRWDRSKLLVIVTPVVFAVVIGAFFCTRPRTNPTQEATPPRHDTSESTSSLTLPIIGNGNSPIGEAALTGHESGDFRIEEPAGQAPQAPIGTNLPDHIRAILDAPTRYPSASDVIAVQPSDIDMLMHHYALQASLTNRVALALALSATGDRRAFEAIAETISNGFSGKELSNREFQAMQVMLRAVGILAEHHEEAYSYLVSRTSTTAWEHPQLRPWAVAANLEPLVGEVMTRVAILSLGLSGRQEAHDVLKALAQNESTTVEPVSGSIVDGVFNASLVAQYDREQFWRIFLSPSAYANEFSRWAENSDQGRHWMEWMRSVDGTHAAAESAPR